ncbi:hypothetical protein M427DRAFT_59361 [Gonapodya prolifera JEL478]|uniref:Uncharacterized protein n=1 Tax=Gonapodya prolifera (strain JEL478) TaxID=1344416 RepID=A0A139A8B1_GONPJ|nr:hypothetical protein M427DRAFT_59361 [Gonapodya prolifera JEL478]|eukprot:KXS12623.1 hypothetical protein M427DRAFT_59361 [Gonapodya prolifera JEL478]
MHFIQIRGAHPGGLCHVFAVLAMAAVYLPPTVAAPTDEKEDPCKPIPDIFGDGTRWSTYIQSVMLIVVYHLMGKDGTDWEGIAFSFLTSGAAIAATTMNGYYYNPNTNVVQLLAASVMILLIAFFNLIHFMGVPVRSWGYVFWHPIMSLGLCAMGIVMAMRASSEWSSSPCIDLKGTAYGLLKINLGYIVAGVAIFLLCVYVFFFIARFAGFGGASFDKYWSHLHVKQYPFLNRFLRALMNPISTACVQMFMAVGYCVVTELWARTLGWSSTVWDFGQILVVASTVMSVIQAGIGIGGEFADAQKEGKKLKVFPDIRNYKDFIADDY